MLLHTDFLILLNIVYILYTQHYFLQETLLFQHNQWILDLLVCDEEIVSNLNDNE